MRKRLLIVISLIFVAGGAALWFWNGKSSVTVPNNTGDFIVYDFGQEINFAKGGNSRQFVKSDEGWGGQEPNYRCTVGKSSVVKLYLVDNTADFELEMTGFGVFDPEDGKQKVTVFANGKKMDEWEIRGLDTYATTIPASVLDGHNLILRFDIAKPYTPPVDTRKLGVAVHEIKLNKIYGAQTKRKIGRWLKDTMKSDESASIFNEGQKTENNK